MHPAISQEARKQISRVDYPYCLLVIPLLTETGGFEGVDRVLLVDIPVEHQISRLTGRDDATAAQARTALAAQASREARLAIADDVIDNSGTQEDLMPQVETLHRKYLELSTRPSN